MNNPKVALIYDFDKTLSPKDMQSYGFMEKLGVKDEEFWELCNVFCKTHKTDRILGYMFMMIQTYKEKNIELSRDFFVNCGGEIELYKGVETWFDRINKFGKSIGVDIEHYVVSSGLKEMIEGTKISKFFKEIYAGYFVYDKDNHPIWPALAINYTNKTQFIYRINKGILNVIDDSINDSMPYDKRPVPFYNMIYIGDSITDIPCMRLISKNGGYSIGVYGQGNNNKPYLNKMLKENRIDFVAPADYSKCGELEKVVHEIIQNIKCSTSLKSINEKQKQNID